MVNIILDLIFNLWQKQYSFLFSVSFFDTFTQDYE